MSPYVKLNENYWDSSDLEDVKMYLPEKISNLGRPPSIGTVEVEKRFRWPSLIKYVPDKCKSKLMGLAIERAIVFFFKNFAYTFAGKVYLQMGGGPIE